MSQVIRNIQAIKKSGKQKVNVVILAAGGSTGSSKSLLMLDNNKTILETQLEIIYKAIPNAEVVLVTGFDADRVMNKFGNELICVENERYEETNTTRSLGIGLRACTYDKVVVIYGDVLFNHHALNKLELEESSTLYNEVVKHETTGCVIHNGKLENLMYGVGKQWIQIFSLVGRELSIAKKLSWDRRNEKLLGFETINKIIDSGGKFQCIYNKNIIANDVDTVRDFKKIRGIVL